MIQFLSDELKPLIKAWHDSEQGQISLTDEVQDGNAKIDLQVQATNITNLALQAYLHLFKNKPVTCSVLGLQRYILRLSTKFDTKMPINCVNYNTQQLLKYFTKPVRYNFLDRFKS